MISRRMKLSIVLGVLLSGLFLYLAFQKIDFSEIWKLIPQINWLVILLLLFPASFLLFGIRTVRWYYLTNSIKNISLLSLFSSTMIGFLINQTLPLRIGEFVRAYSLSRKEDIKVAECFGTIITERVFDLLALLMIFIPLLLIPAVYRKLGSASFFIFGFSLLFFGIFVYVSFFGSKLLENKFVVKLVPDKILRVIFDVIKGLQSIKSARNLLIILFFSLLFWICCGYFYYLSLKIFHISGLPPWSGFFILLLIAFGVALPSSPGYIGNYHYFAMLGLEYFGVSKEIALGYAIFTHALQAVFVVSVGVICLFSEGLKFSDIWSQNRAPGQRDQEKNPQP